MAFKPRKTLLFAFGLVVLGVLLYHFRSHFNFGQFRVAKLRDALSEVRLPYIAAAVILIYVCYFLRAVRWRNFQKHVGEARLLPILGMTIAGFASIFLFGRLGEPVRPVLISRKEKVPLADTFGIYTLERLIDLAFSGVVLAAWFLIATVQKQLQGEDMYPALETVRKTAGTILAVGILGAAAVFLYFRTHGNAAVGGGLKSWIERGGWRAAVARIVVGVGRGLKTIRTWRDLLAAVAVSTLHWLLIICVYYLIFQGFGGKLAELRFQDAMLALALTLVGSILQLPGIGGGPQAVMIAALTRFYGVGLETAGVAAMIVYLVTFAACIFVGVPILLREGFSLNELRRMRQQEDSEIDSEATATP